jgi:glycosyltransferase involved in cell wall biosynthesis
VTAAPRVSILLPTYNRARFLPAAIAAITGQTFADWELIVVDDGSTDGTGDVVARLTARVPQRVLYRRQANAGAYAARNAALDLAQAPLVAFYDSDDLWLPHHLDACVSALKTAPDVDWVYGACRIVELRTGRVSDPDTFRVQGRPRPFHALRTRTVGSLRVIADDRAVARALRDGLMCGLQNSVIRRSVFEKVRFHTAFRNEAEDQLFVVRAIKAGCRLGYLDDVHVQYQVHEGNSSASSTGQNVDQQLAIYRAMVRGFRELAGEVEWTPRERRELARRLLRDDFWHIGYAVLWKAGRRAEALEAFRSGLRAWPWSPACWKTYVLARLRVALG